MSKRNVAYWVIGIVGAAAAIGCTIVLCIGAKPPLELLITPGVGIAAVVLLEMGG